MDTASTAGARFAEPRVPAPPLLTYGIAGVIGVFAFAFRILTLQDLPNDHYLYLSAAQQILLGDMPDRDFVEPGMLLQFLVSAAGQAVAPGPSTEAILTAGFLAMAAAATCVGVSWLTGSIVAGGSAALLQVVIEPRLYSFPKILVPAVLLVLALRYARRPNRPALFLLALWVVAAFLFRHDIGTYAGVAAVVCVAMAARTAAGAARAGAALSTAVLLLLLPYFAYLEWGGGVVGHVHGSIEFAKAEAHQFRFDWPVLGFGASGPADSALPWSKDDAAAFLFYCAYALPLVSMLLLGRAEYRRNVVVRSAVGSAVVMGVFYAAILLRHPLVVRVQDLAAVYAILGAWCVVALIHVARAWRPAVASPWRILLQGLVAVALAALLISVDVLDQTREKLQDMRVLRSAGTTLERARQVITGGREWPWRRYWPAGPLDPIQYLDACTRPEDRIWVTWLAPEYYVFARRGFGAGLPSFQVPHSHTVPEDQAQMIARLDRDAVPIVLINESARSEFAGAYPQLDEYLRSRYWSPSGSFTIYDGSLISIVVRRGLRATSAYGSEAWPCHLEPDPEAESDAMSSGAGL